MLTVTASEARAKFSKLGDEIVRTGKPVTVFKNSRPWLIMAPVQPEALRETMSAEELALLAWSETFVDEYRDVFEVLSK